MPARDILLQMVSYPVPTPHWAIDAAGTLAESLGALLSAGLCRVYAPDVSNWLADKLAHADEAIATENCKSLTWATELLAAFSARIPRSRRGDEILIECSSLIKPRDLAQRARTRDLTVVPACDGLDWSYVAEGLIFESGRPVLLLPAPNGAAHRYRSIAVGWDGSRAAARAIADALPLLSAADTVELLVVTGDKQLSPVAGRGEAQRHLAAHGISATMRTIEAQHRDAGTALCDEAGALGSDLLVMGAFGHSRVREFVLGGATQTMLDGVRLPVLLSH
ncbi:universal stress protein [Sphingomonas lycopersici]|uniref:universal stress protein n=1 Tax=Sphingomonas lycopersici TaxID=2951807 RepID=UPI0022372D05|nr:universal stress protein [Sphingomonas lycopersici]